MTLICGFVTDVSVKAIWVDGVKYAFDHDYNYTAIDEFVVIYMDHSEEIVDSALIAEAYHFNIDSKVYHTWECHHYNDRVNASNWKIGEQAVKEYIAQDDKIDSITFTPCKDCHADGKITIME